MSGPTHRTVAEGEGDQRLDRWFRRHFPHVTQGMIERMLRKGEMRIDGARAKASDRVAPGQVIRIPPLPAADADGKPVPAAQRPPPADLVALLRRAVLYRDDDLLVIDKPAGLAVQGGTGQVHHLDGVLALLDPDAAEPPRLVHRLDRDTSGLLVLARSREAAARMTGAFRGRGIAKTYLAAVAGRPSPARGRIDLALGKGGEPGHERMRVVAPEDAARGGNEAGGQSAETDYLTLESAGNRASAVALRPLTGRTHQLRVHLAAIGCPILGDGKYAGRSQSNEGDGWGAGAGPSVSRRLHLHAAALAFAHPRTGRMLRLVAPLPDHMRATWRLFEWDEPDLRHDLFGD